MCRTESHVHEVQWQKHDLHPLALCGMRSHHCGDANLPLCRPRLKTSDRQALDAFEDELSSFISRVKKRAQAKVEEAMKEYEEVGGGCVCVCTCAHVGMREFLCVCE